MTLRLRVGVLATALLLGAACAVPPVGAQPSSKAVAPASATLAKTKAGAILGERDDYVRATAPLERSAKLKTADPVDEGRFVHHMQSASVEWSGEQRKNLAPLIDALAGFLKNVKWRMPDRILLVQSAPSLEDDLPHTRANAIISPASFYRRGPGMMTYVLAHETFHILTRTNAELRERLYAAIGFKRCETVAIPPEIARLRITNPDMVESRHTIAVRYQGQPVEALPYIRFSSGDIDPREGFSVHLQVAWLLVDRKGDVCTARSGPGASVAPQDLQGLFEQVGRNTEYLFHAEEILAENFVQLFVASMSGTTRGVQSPEIIEKIRGILFE